MRISQGVLIGLPRLSSQHKTFTGGGEKLAGVTPTGEAGLLARLRVAEGEGAVWAEVPGLGGVVWPVSSLRLSLGLLGAVGVPEGTGDACSCGGCLR